LEAVEMPEEEQYSPKAEARAKREKKDKAKKKQKRRKGMTEDQEEY
jgi:hypothetical protein